MATRTLARMAVAAFVLAACTGGSPDDTSSFPPTDTNESSPTASPRAIVTNLDSFTEALASAGHTVQIGGRTGLEVIFGVRGHPVSFDVARVMAFEYPSERAAKRLQTSVDGDGYMVGHGIIDWTNPHLYRGGSLIVVYLGDKPAAIRTIEGLLGPQFAPR